MEHAAWTAGDAPVVGIVGPATTDSPTTNRTAAVEALESTLLAGDAVDVTVSETPQAVLDADPDLIVAVGRAALSSLARVGASTSVLPVDIATSFEAGRADEYAEAVRSVLEEGALERHHPVLAVETDDGRHEHAAFDVTLVTEEPATISEYSVRRRENPVGRFRADGVVVATPIGSAGYANAAGGPLLDHELEAVSVVPISPFNTRADHWVAPAADLSLVVERDEGTVVLCVDDRELGPVEPRTAVSLSVDGSLPMLVPTDAWEE